MSTPFSLYKSATDEYINDEFIERIYSGFSRKDQYSALTAFFAPIGAPRSAIINRCRERAGRDSSNSEARKLFWIEPFHAWEMFSIGNLSLALLWHIHRSLPREVISDEKIIYKLGKISVTLPALTDGLKKTGTGYGYDPDRHTSISSKAYPADRKSSVSSIFSACEQITELSEAFRSIGAQIAASGHFDAMVIPIIDIDQCLPEQAVSLLFAIRNYICCDSISFLVAAEEEILTNYFISIYDNALTYSKANSTLHTLFDDWVLLPVPSLGKMVQNIDKTLDTKNCDYIINKIAESGILAGLSDYIRMHNSFYRFNLFKNHALQQHSLEETTLCLLLFLAGGVEGAHLKSLALRPDLEQTIASIRSEKNPNHRSLEHGGTTASLIPMGTFLPGVIKTAASSLSDSSVAQWLVRIVPFI
jgi:hypothetical protein